MINEFLKENEISVNDKITKVMLKSNITIFIIIVVQLLNIFNANMIDIIIFSIVGFSVFTIPYIYRQIKGDTIYLKYIIITSISILASVSHILFWWRAYLLWTWIIAISCLYLDIKLFKITAVVSAFLIIVSEILCGAIGYRILEGVIILFNAQKNIQLITGNATILSLEFSIFFFIILSYFKRSQALLSKFQELYNQSDKNFSRNLDMSKKVESLVKNLKSDTVDTTNNASDILESLVASNVKYATFSNHFKQTTETVKDISKQINNIQDKINFITSSTNSLSELSSKSKVDLQKSINKTKESESITNQTIETIKGLADSSKDIDKITKIISNISDRINLVALNATIEAARAGEAGLGFSVVAEEVGKLSKQSKSAAEDIVNIVKSISEKLITAVNAIGTIKETVSNSSTLVGNVLPTFDAMNIEQFNILDEITNLSKSISNLYNNSNSIQLTLGELIELNGGSLLDMKDIEDSTKEMQLRIMGMTKQIGEINERVRSIVTD